MPSLNPLKWGRKDQPPSRAPERKALSFPLPTSNSSTPYSDGWEIERAVDQAVNRVVWVFKSVHAIAGNAAGLPMLVRQDNPDDGAVVKNDPLNRLLNRNPNPYQDAWSFRYMLSAQILLSRRGVFIEVVRDRIDRPRALYILPPQHTRAIPHPTRFIAGFEVSVPQQEKRFLRPDQVVWLGLPHPLDPYQRMTPLESAGLSVEVDWYARLYNRNFLQNDGRPGGILLVDGELDDDDIEELRRRFMGTTGNAISGAGRVSVIEAEQASFVDTATSARDGQYMEARTAAKVETLIAFGVPESVIGNAAGRTFDNADAELEIFWRETMRMHLRLISDAFTAQELDNHDHFVTFDLSKVPILGRDERERQRFHLEELRQQAIAVDEYRELTGREAIGATKVWVPVNYQPVADIHEGEIELTPVPNGSAPAGPPSPARVGPNAPESDVIEGNDGKALELEAVEAKALPPVVVNVSSGGEPLDEDRLVELIRKAGEPQSAEATTERPVLIVQEREAPTPTQYKDVNFVPPPEMREASRRGLDLHARLGRGGTPVTLARANSISNGKALTPVVVRRIRDFLDQNSDALDAVTDDATDAQIAGLLLGGKPGLSWAKAIIERMEARDNAAVISAAEDAIQIARKDIDLRLGRWERSVAAQVLRYLKRQERVVVEKLGGAKTRGRYENGKGIDPATVFDIDIWNEQLRTDGKGWIEAVADDFGSDVAFTFGGTYSVEDADVDQQVERLLKINTTTMDRITKAINEDAVDGEPLDDVIARVKHVYGLSETRSEKIGRTEVVAAANAAALAAARRSAMGTKTWVSSYGARDDHAEMHGTTVDINDEFKVGADTLQHPGDPGASPDNTVNCRCALIFTQPVTVSG